MALLLATRTSVKRGPTVSKVLLKYPLRSKKFNTSWPIYNNLSATCITMPYNALVQQLSSVYNQLAQCTSEGILPGAAVILRDQAEV